MTTVLDLVRQPLEVRCADGVVRRCVDLDNAATAPALQAVVDAVAEFLPCYASVHRGAGPRSCIATRWYEDAREAVGAFVDARDDDVVAFVANTTDATNMVAAMLPPGTRVLGSPAEHHANLLPWQRHRLDLLPFTSSPEELVDACGEALSAAAGEIRLVAVTGASNVTGEVTPLRELAAVAHRHGAELLVDAAQLAPHRRISLRETGVDYVAFSGHKLYSPFGAGALVGRAASLCTGEPYRRGGGAAVLVGLDEVVWADGVARLEAGSPNAVGAVALAAACRVLGEAMTELEPHERALADRLERGVTALRDMHVLRQWPAASDRVGVCSFVLDGYEDDLLAAILAGEWGIGVRAGRFCAHPLVAHLLAGRPAGAGGRPPGAVRASIGAATTGEDVDRLLEALAEIAERGPRLRYHREPGSEGWRADVVDAAAA